MCSLGLTAENLKDDLLPCICRCRRRMPISFFSLIKTTLKDIMTTVSGQFIIYNDGNNQYYIDVIRSLTTMRRSSRRLPLWPTVS